MGRKLAVFAVLAAIVLAVLWLLLDDDSTSEGNATKPAPPDAVEAKHEKDAPRPRAGRTETPPAPAAETPAPPPVPAGPTLTGRVIDADGHPVAGARVVTNPDDLSKPVDILNSGAKDSRTFVATSAEDGRFEVRVDEKSVQTILTATSDAGFGQAAAARADRDVEVKLVKWTLLTGKVTNIAKEPIAGAMVTVHLLLDALTADRTAVTDSNGDYRIERLPPVGWTPNVPYVGRGRHAWVIAEADGYAPLLVERDGMGGPRAGDPAKVDLVLVRGITLTGKVVDGDTNAGIAGATVVCWSVEGMMSFGGAGGGSLRNPWGPRPLGETRSADDGTFRFEHLPAQGPNGVASHNGGKRGQTLGHVAAWKDGYVYGGDEIPVSKDETVVETTIDLWPSAEVTGRVVDAAGKPVEGATVWADVSERRPALNGFPDFFQESRDTTVKTGADGTYSIRTLRASHSGPTTGKLSAYKTGGGVSYSSPQVEVTANASETVTAPDLVIDTGAIPGATIVVSDESGAPLVGATIERQYQTSRTGLDGRAAWSLGFAPKSADAKIVEVSVTVRARGFAPRLVTFTPTRGTPVEVPVTMKRGLRVAGRVVRADGKPAANASIVVGDGTKSESEVFGDGSRPAAMDSRGDSRLVVFGSAAAADDGTFEVVDLPDGPYLVAAQMQSRAPSGFNRMPKMLSDVRPGVVAGATDLLLTIPADDAPPTQPLEIVVTDGNGAAVETAGAFASVGGARLYAQRKDAKTLRFEALPAGQVSIQVTAKGWAKQTLRDVLVPADRPPETITVKFDRGITLRGTVRADSGSLPAQAGFTLWPVETGDPMGLPSGEVGKDGAFEISGLLPGRYRVMFYDLARRDGTVSFVPSGDGILTLSEDRTGATADLLVVRAGTLSFSVSDPRLPAMQFGGAGSTPAKDSFGAASRVDIVDSAGAVVSAQCPVYADYSPSVGLAPGDYTVRLTLSGERPQEQRCTVKAGETAYVRFPAR